MKTVLVVEDEKLIRQGIKTMIRRSGVPVEMIIECNNGEAALEVIKEQQIDVMFTDIRMPKMDGIELVQKMQTCEHVPLTVAISGYDDFSYAVDMMRNGVREYLLKPVERDKITEILKKLNEEIESAREQEKTKQKFGYQQIKHLMLFPGTTEEEIAMIESQYADQFVWELGGENYVVCCQNHKEDKMIPEENYTFLSDIEGNDIFIIEEGKTDTLLRNEFSQGYVGISSPHQGIRELRTAYLESVQMRKKAFCRNLAWVRSGEETEHIPEKLMEEAKKLTGEEARMQRVQVLGTERKEETQKIWKQFFFEVEKGRISENTYEECMKDFFTEEKKIYRSILESGEKIWEEMENIFADDCIGIYEEKMLHYLGEVQESIIGQFDANKNSHKMQQAVAYIAKNYASDLNMAVVSNYLSMNYSLFSYSFKQYTGSNFVNYLKDIRMKEAKRLLGGTDMRIVDISRAVGYENEKHFMKTFKNSCGVSPSEYRKNMNCE